MKLTQRDKKLLLYLRKNSRATLTEISKATQIPISTLYDRLKAQSGSIIQKHTTLVNFDALGFHTRAQVLLKVSPELRRTVVQRLHMEPQVNSLYSMAHDYDYCLEAVFKHVRDAQEFVNTLVDEYNISEYKTYFIVEDLIREAFYSEKAL